MGKEYRCMDFAGGWNHRLVIENPQSGFDRQSRRILSDGGVGRIDNHYTDSYEPPAGSE
jgi:hypothetical protein